MDKSNMIVEIENKNFYTHVVDFPWNDPLVLPE